MVQKEFGFEASHLRSCSHPACASKQISVGVSSRVAWDRCVVRDGWESVAGRYLMRSVLSFSYVPLRTGLSIAVRNRGLILFNVITTVARQVDLDSGAFQV